MSFQCSHFVRKIRLLTVCSETPMHDLFKQGPNCHLNNPISDTRGKFPKSLRVINRYILLMFNCKKVASWGQ